MSLSPKTRRPSPGSVRGRLEGRLDGYKAALIEMENKVRDLSAKRDELWDELEYLRSENSTLRARLNTRQSWLRGGRDESVARDRR